MEPANGEARRLTWLRVFSVPVGLGAAWYWISHAPAATESLIYDSIAQAATVFTLAVYLPLAVIAAVLGLVCRVRPLRVGSAPVRWGLAGLAAGALGLAFSAGGAWLAGGVLPGTGTAGAAFIATGLVLTAIQSGAEELLLRGWLQPVLVGIGGPGAGIVGASVLFAGLHLAGGQVAPTALINMTLAGMMFGLLAWRSGGMIAPCAAHFAWNAVEDLGFGLVPNPGVGPFGALLDIEIAGPARWGGSGEGLDAGYPTMAVLIVLVLVLARRLPGTGSLRR